MPTYASEMLNSKPTVWKNEKTPWTPWTCTPACFTPLPPPPPPLIASPIKPSWPPANDTKKAFRSIAPARTRSTRFVVARDPSPTSSKSPRGERHAPGGSRGRNRVRAGFPRRSRSTWGRADRLRGPLGRTTMPAATTAVMESWREVIRSTRVRCRRRDTRCRSRFVGSRVRF